MDRMDLGSELFLKGYNCAQATLGAFEQDLGRPLKDLLKIASAFGGGFARTRGQCGTVSAMAMVLGLMTYDETAQDVNRENAKIYALTTEAISAFREKNQSITCGELLKNVKNLTSGGAPDARTQEYYKYRPCAKFVRDAIAITETLLNLKCQT